MPLILSIIIAALVGIVLGAVVMGLVQKSKNSAVTARLEDTKQQLEDSRQQAADSLKKAEEEYNKRLSELKADEQRHYESALAAKDAANKARFGTGGPDYTIPAEFVPEHKHKKPSRAITTSRLLTSNNGLPSRWRMWPPPAKLPPKSC